MRLLSIGLATAAGLMLPLVACTRESDAANPTGPSYPATASQTLSTSDLPKLRAGRWVMRNVDFKGDQASRELLDEEPEYICVPAGGDVLQTSDVDLANCPKHSISRRGGAVVIEARCRSQDIDSSMKATYSGDFQSGVKADIELGMAPVGQPLETIRVTVHGRYEGPCKGDEG